MSKVKMRLGHSPDPDDAFMFYGISAGKVTSDKIEFEHVIEDIQSLNKRALNKELETTAISAHGYLKVQDDYRIMSCGASMGEGYGPIVVSSVPTDDFHGKKIGVPGMLTTAYLLLNIYTDGFIPVEMPFDEIMPAVARGDIDTGLIIHEGQLTYKDYDLELLVDLGVKWQVETTLPLPLGLNVVKRDMGEELQKEVHMVHKESIEYGLAHKKEALEYAMKYGRGIKEDVGEKFVLMYVNQYTLALGGKGKAALEFLYKRAYEKGVITEEPRLDVLEG